MGKLGPIELWHHFNRRITQGNDNMMVLKAPTISDSLSAPQHQATKPPRLSVCSNMTIGALASHRQPRQTDTSVSAESIVASESNQRAPATPGT